MVASSWGRYNFVLPYGRVIKRYDVAGPAQPVEQAPVIATGA
jgi:acetoacetate decarboxylase